MAGVDDIDYEVDQFLDKRHVGATVEYLVRWKGFNSDWDSWEPVGGLQNCKTKINLFEKQLRSKTSEKPDSLENITNKKMARKKDVAKVLAGKIRKKSIHQKASMDERLRRKPDSKKGKQKDEIGETDKPVLKVRNSALSTNKKQIMKESNKVRKVSTSSGTSEKNSQKKKTGGRKGKEDRANIRDRKQGNAFHKSQERDTSSKDARIKKVANDLANINSEKKKANVSADNDTAQLEDQNSSSTIASKLPSTSSTGKVKQKRPDAANVKGTKRKLSENTKSPGSVKKIKGDSSENLKKTKTEMTSNMRMLVSPKVLKTVKSNSSGTLKSLPSPQPKLNKSVATGNQGEHLDKTLKPKIKKSSKPSQNESSSSAVNTNKTPNSKKKSVKNSQNENAIVGSNDEGNNTSKSKVKNASSNSKGEINNKPSKLNGKKSSKQLMNTSASSPKNAINSLKMQSKSTSPKLKKGSSLSSSKKKNSQFRLSIANLIGLNKSDQNRKSSEPSKNNKGFNKFSGKVLSHARKQHMPSDEPVDILIDDSDDDDILYSLSDTEIVLTPESDKNSSPSHQKGKSEAQPIRGGSVVKKKSASTSTLKSKNSSNENVATKGLTGRNDVPSKRGKSSDSSRSGNQSGRSKMKKIRLLDSLRQSPNKLVGAVSPNLLYTTVKSSGFLSSALQTSYQRIQSHLPWTIPQEGMVHPSSNNQASLPISPASMSYKVLLENLPHQLHPKKNKKSGAEAEEDIERRLSVRASECAFKYKEILIKKCNRFTQIWLNTHTKMKNVLNPQVIQEVTSALNAAMYDDSNLVMLSGLGNVFCSGIDLHYLTTGDKKNAARKMVDALRDLVRKFVTFPKLLVAVVTGPAIGLGSALLPLCDIVYASDKASFYMPYAELSQTPEGCASYTLPNCVGLAMANELLIGGRKITAIEACQLGLVSQVYWPTSMMQEVIPRVQHMALLSGKVLETTKLLMRSQQRTKLEHTNDSECNLLLDIWPSSECQRSIEQYLSNEKNYTL